MQEFRYSDLITTTRIFVVSIVAAIISFEPEVFKFIPGLILIAFIFFTDTLDGIVARRLKENSKFGAFYDIVGDRITEIVLLVPFTYLQIANPIFLIYFVTKGFLIDYLRFKKFNLGADVPFKQFDNRLFLALTGARPMRAVYGFSKMIMIFLFYSLIFYTDKEWLSDLSKVIAWVTIFISTLRSLPSFVDYFYTYFRKDKAASV